MARASVLIIENDRNYVESLSELFSTHDIEVSFATEGNSGLQMVEDVDPDLIVLSVELPTISGYSVCKKLKKDPKAKGTPLILISATASEETFEQHKQLKTRADVYLLKPFEADALWAAAEPFFKAAEADKSESDEDMLDLSGDLPNELDNAFESIVEDKSESGEAEALTPPPVPEPEAAKPEAAKPEAAKPEAAKAVPPPPAAPSPPPPATSSPPAARAAADDEEEEPTVRGETPTAADSGAPARPATSRTLRSGAAYQKVRGSSAALSGLQAELQSLRDQIDRREREYRELQDRHTATLAEVFELREFAETAEAENADLRVALDVRDKEVAAASDASRKELTEKSAALEAAQNELGDLRKELEAAKESNTTAVAAKEAALAEATSKAEAVRKELEETKAKLEEANTKVDAQGENIQDLKASVDGYETRLTNRTQDLKTARTEVEDAQKRVAELEEELLAAKSKAESLESDTGAAEKAAEEAKAEIGQLRTKVEEAEKALGDKERALEAAQGERESLKTTLEERTKELEAAKKAAAGHSKELEEARAGADKVEVKLRRSRERIQALTQQRAKAEEHLMSVNAAREEERRRADAAVAYLQQALTEQQTQYAGDVETLTGALAAYTESQATIASTFDAAKGHIADLEMRLGATNRVFSEITTALERGSKETSNLPKPPTFETPTLPDVPTVTVAPLDLKNAEVLVAQRQRIDVHGGESEVAPPNGDPATTAEMNVTAMAQASEATGDDGSGDDVEPSAALENVEIEEGDVESDDELAAVDTGEPEVDMEEIATASQVIRARGDLSESNDHDVATVASQSALDVMEIELMPADNEPSVEIYGLEDAEVTEIEIEDDKNG